MYLTAKTGLSESNGQAFLMLDGPNRVRSGYFMLWVLYLPCVGTLADGLGHDAKRYIVRQRGQLRMLHFDELTGNSVNAI